MMKSDFSGSTFNVFEQKPTGKINIIATIYYKEVSGFTSKPRCVELYLIKENESIQELTQLDPKEHLKSLYEKDFTDKITKLINKEPQLNEEGNFYLNITDKSMLSSVKNTVLVNE